MARNDRVHGACLCRALRFSLALPTKWVAHCHCTMCQRAHGAAFVTWAGFDAEALQLADGAEPLLQWYRSSPEAERSFCRQCGSSLFFRSDKWPGEVHVARANLEDALDRMPQAHVFYDAHVPWFEVNDGLPRKL